MKKRLISVLLTLSMVLPSGLPVLAGEDNDSYHYVYNNSSDDYDNDGIINEDEIEMGTNPYIKDSDFDSLSDSYEIEIGTDPTCEDTDGDGASDGLEIEYGTDPLIFNPNFTEIAETQLLSDIFSITVSAEAIVGGESLGSFSLNPVTYNDVPFISKTIPGYIGNACELSFVGDAEKVTLEFLYDITQEMEDDAFEPVIYQFDFVSQDFHEVLDQTSCEGVITATVYECGIFIMLNKAEYDPIETYSMFSLARAVPSTNLEDYYEDIYWGRISLVSGAKAFAGYDFSVNNDYDGDGLTNDEEIEIRVNSNGTPEIYMYSNPVYNDSDGDGIDDFYDEYPLAYSYSSDASKAIDKLLDESLYDASYMYDEIYGEFGYDRVWNEAFSILGYLDYGSQKSVIKSEWLEYLLNYHDIIISETEKKEIKNAVCDSYADLIDAHSAEIKDIVTEIANGTVDEILNAKLTSLKNTRTKLEAEYIRATSCGWDTFDDCVDDWKNSVNSLLDENNVKISSTIEIKNARENKSNKAKVVSYIITAKDQIDDLIEGFDAISSLNANANVYSVCISLFEYLKEYETEDEAIREAAEDLYNELCNVSEGWSEKTYIVVEQALQWTGNFAWNEIWDKVNLPTFGSIVKTIIESLIKVGTATAYKQNKVIANESLVRSAHDKLLEYINRDNQKYVFIDTETDIDYVTELITHLAQLRLNGEIKYTEARANVDFLRETLNRILSYADSLNTCISENLIERCYLVTDPNISISITDDIDVNDSDFDFTPAQGDYKIYFNGEQQYYSVTGSDMYTFHLTPGYTYVVTVVGWYNSSNTGYHYQRQTITVSEDQTYNLAYTFNYYDGTYVEGTVTGDSINSVNGTNISIREGHNNKSGNVSASCVYPNYGNNHYRILLPKGDYTAEVSCKGYDTKYYNFTVTGAQVLQTQNFSLASQLQVTGHVVNDQTGAAIANAKVTLYHDLLSGMDVVFYTDSTGHIAEYASLSTILNKARIEADGYLPKTIGIDYNMTSNRYMLGEIELSPTYTYTVSGKVTDGSNAIKGVQVTLNNADGVAYSPVVTDNNGKYSFNNIAKGIYRLVLTHTDYETAEKNLTVNNSNVTVEDIVMNKKTVTQTYTIKFDANGGSYKDTSTVKTLIKTHDVPLIFNVEQPTRDGYDFLGWAGTKTATSREYMQGGTFRKNVSMYLYAVWKKQDTSATMVYDHGDWIVNPDNPNESIVEHATPFEVNVSNGTTYALVDPVIPSYNGNSFKGWMYYKNGGAFTDTNGNAYTLLQPGDTIILDPTDGVYNAVYAKWEYYVRYDDGQNVTLEKVGNGNDYVIKEPAYSNGDKDFLRWRYVDSNNTTHYVYPGDTLDLTEDLTLTAIWGDADTGEEATYTVEYNKNGGKGSVDSQSAEYGTTITLSDGSELSRSGYYFIGWATAKSADKPEYAGSSTYTVTDDVTLYAVWREKSDKATISVTTDKEYYAPGETATLIVNADGSDHFYVNTKEQFTIERMNGSTGHTGGTFVEQDSPCEEHTENRYENGVDYKVKVFIPEDCEEGEYEVEITVTNGIYDGDTGNIPGTETSRDDTTVIIVVKVITAEDTKLNIKKSSITLHMDNTERLNFTISPEELREQIEWESSDEDVVKITRIYNKYVKIKATGYGEAEITATVNGVEDSCTVYVERCSFDIEDTDEDYLKTPATCEDYAVYYYSCECGNTEYDTFIDYDGGYADHDYGEWKTVTEPTETETGLKQRTCSVCGDVEEEEIPALGHSYSDEWFWDETNHWHECDCGEKSDEAAHADENGDGKCDECDYVVETEEPHEHEFGTDWESDENGHWHECECGEKSDEAAHADEDGDGKCDECDYVVETEEPHEHEFGTDWESDENGHWHECECGEKSDKAAHADEDGDGKCDECDYVVETEEPHEHEPAAEWKSDETYHWHECTGEDCDELLDKAAHADEDGDGKCDECDYVVETEEPHEHEPAAEWKSDEAYHWHECTGEDCDEILDKAAHADEDGDGKCDECDYVVETEEPHEHEPAAEWKSDETYHWHECTGEDCDELLDKARHTASDWIVDEKATEKHDGLQHKECTVCGYILDVETIPALKSDFNSDEWYRHMMILMNQKYTITANAGEGGSISNEGRTTVKFSNNITYNITPDEGYEIEAVYVDNVDVGAVESYTFKRVNKDHTIHAVFAEIEEESIYADIEADDWFYDDVVYVTGNGLMNGTGDNEFSPDVNTTRAMIVTILWRLEGEAEAADAGFTDVAADMWYTEAIDWAAANGIVNGFGDGTFGPEKNITREQVMAILHRYAAYKGWDDGLAVSMIPQFDCSVWAENDVNWADMNGLLDNLGVDVIDMTVEVDRAEIAAYLRRFCENIAE